MVKSQLSCSLWGVLSYVSKHYMSYKKILEKHLDSPSKWNIYPLQDLLDLDEKNWSTNPADDQINVPANAKNQWKWRMKIFLEYLLT